MRASTWGRRQLAWLDSLAEARTSMLRNGPVQFIRAWLRRVSLHGDGLAWEVSTTVFMKDPMHMGGQVWGFSLRINKASTGRVAQCKEFA